VTRRTVFPHPALLQPSTTGIQDFTPLTPFSTCHIKPGELLLAFWHSGLVCAEVLVICLWVWLAPKGMHHHLPSRSTRLK
jgi:hypothetical protein